MRTAAVIFERDGFESTNSNSIAREAGYSPGTFYKHFADKREIFLAAYGTWVREEWRSIGEAMRVEGDVNERAAAVVRAIIDHHRRWSGFRAELRSLTARDFEIRRAHATERKAQLKNLSSRGGATLEEDVVLMLTIERVGDAIASGEAELLGADEIRLLDALTALLAQRLARPPRR